MTTIDVWQIRRDRYPRYPIRPHVVGIDFTPTHFVSAGPSRGKAAGGMQSAIRRARIARKKADRQNRFRDQRLRRIVSGQSGLMPVDRRRDLQDGFEVDRYGVLTGGDHVLVVHVRRTETVQQGKPGARASEEAGDSRLVRTAGVTDELGPPVTRTGDRADRAQFGRSALLSVQPFDQVMPSGIDTQVFGLVQHPATTGELQFQAPNDHRDDGRKVRPPCARPGCPGPRRRACAPRHRRGSTAAEIRRWRRSTAGSAQR